MNYKRLIRCDGASLPEIGTGHVIRDISIAKTLINDECIKQMKELKSDSVDIIICDPPYNIGKDFGNDSDKQELDKYLI